MKSLKQIAMASLALGALSANAQWAVTLSDTGVNAPGAISASSVVSPYTGHTIDSYDVGNAPLSGSSTYTFSISGSGLPGYASFSVNDALEVATYNNALSPAGTLFNVNDITVLNGATPVAGNLSGNTWISTGSASDSTFTVTVDWTLNGVFNSYPSWTSSFDIITGASVTSSGISAQNEEYLTAVPEPGQVIGGCMLLGCGALVFTGRRFMAKKA